MFKSHAFDYINVLDKAADAAWLRNDAIANNIANVIHDAIDKIDDQIRKALDEAHVVKA